MRFRWLLLIISGFFWLVAGGLALFLLTLVLVVMGPLSLVLGPIGALLMLLVIARSARLVRRARAAMILNYLEQPIRLNLPIGPMLGAASRSEHGALARRLASLRRTIDSGQPIGEALAACAPEVPDRIVDLVAASERIGRMPQVLARLTREDKQRAREFMYQSFFGWSYAVVLVLFLFFILGGVGIFIMPKFEEIFNDFGATMPWYTLVTFKASRNLAWVLLPLSGIFLLGASGWAVREMVHGAQRVLSLGWLWNRLIGYIPIARGVARDRGLADACQVIEQSLRAGDTLESAVFEASELKTLTVLRRRLQRFAEYLHAGQALRDAAHEAGMPPLMVGMLATGQASCNPVKVFEFLGRYYANKFSRAATVIQASVMPAVVLCMSVLVGWVVVSLFMPLVTLIEHTTIMVELI